MGILIISVTLLTYLLGTLRARLLGTVVLVAIASVVLFCFISTYSLAAAPSHDFVYYNLATYKVWGVFIGGKLHYTIPASSVRYVEITKWVNSQLGGQRGIEDATRGRDIILVGVFIHPDKKTVVPTILTLPLHDVLFFDDSSDTLMLNTKYYIPRAPWEYLFFIPVRDKITYHLFTTVYSKP